MRNTAIYNNRNDGETASFFGTIEKNKKINASTNNNEKQRERIQQSCMHVAWIESKVGGLGMPVWVRQKHYRIRQLSRMKNVYVSVKL